MGPRSALVVVTAADRERLPEVVDAALEATGDRVAVLVVPSVVPDGVGAVAEELTVYRPRLHVLLPGPGSTGSAAAGVRWAIEHGHDAVVLMDADGSHRPEDLPGLLAALESHELAVGTRTAAGGSVSAGNALVRAALRTGLRDVTSGFVAVRAEALHLLPLERLARGDRAFRVDLLRAALAAGLTVVEVPIAPGERGTGLTLPRAAVVLLQLRSRRRP